MTLVSKIITSELALFADDSVLYGVVNNISSAEVLQSDLNKLVVWSEKWQMTFNASKCFLLRVTSSRDNVVDYTYTMMGEPITSVTQHKYLGVELDSKLTWNEHISAITGKANSSLGFLRKKSKLPRTDQDAGVLFFSLTPLGVCMLVVGPAYTKKHSIN